MKQNNVRLPKSIRILGVEHPVVAAKDRIDVDTDRRDSLFGQYVGATGELRVFAGLGRAIARETLVHETLHAISHQLKLDLEEDTVVRLATALVPLILDNAWLKEV